MIIISIIIISSSSSMLNIHGKRWATWCNILQIVATCEQLKTNYGNM